MKKAFLFFAAMWVVLAATAIMLSHARAEEVEMELKVSNGITEREYHLSSPDGTMMQCLFQGPIIASKWMQENLIGRWIVLRYSCGPPRRSM